MKLLEKRENLIEEQAFLAGFVQAIKSYFIPTN